MNKLFTLENIGIMLASSRESRGKSQRYMSRSMNKSISTIQNWEYGYSSPNLVELMEWFEILGLNPLKYVLNTLHPDTFNFSETADILEVRESLLKWFTEISSDSDIRKIAYCIFGSTGSSWSGQLDEMCALNHLPIMDRINVADNISNLYNLRKLRGELRGQEYIQPDEDNLKECIYKCKVAVIDNKEEYSN